MMKVGEPTDNPRDIAHDVYGLAARLSRALYIDDAADARSQVGNIVDRLADLIHNAKLFPDEVVHQFDDLRRRLRQAD